MKRFFFTAPFFILSAIAADPLVDYNFTGETPVYGGEYEKPKFNRKYVYTPASDRAMQLAGNGELVIPESTDISLRNGGTLFAIVKFTEDGVKDNANDAHDMIFFKNNEFLLGRMGRQLYFNMGYGKGWVMSCTADHLPVKEKVAVAVTVAQKDKSYQITLYINGKTVANKTFSVPATYKISNKNVSIGKGWGGPWFMTGNLYKVAIYDEALSAEVIQKLSRF